ncbi:MAG: hypothetical protein U0894_02400 [Pirellulales bacterium]
MEEVELHLKGDLLLLFGCGRISLKDAIGSIDDGSEEGLTGADGAWLFFHLEEIVDELLGGELWPGEVRIDLLFLFDGIAFGFF